MMKKLLPLLFLLSLSPCQASWLSYYKKPSKLEKCITSTAVLLGTLSTINSVKDKECTKNSIEALKVLQKELDNTQAAKELYYAISNTTYEKAVNLLKNKPDLYINSRFGKYNYTALMKCCYKGDSSLSVVEEILKHPKLKLTVKNNIGENCLHYACFYVTPEITKLLLTRGDINQLLNTKQNGGYTPLDYTFGHIKHSKGKMDDITIWSMMVAQGAQLNYFKQQYKQLDSKKFKSPHSKYVDTIKANPLKKVVLTNEQATEELCWAIVHQRYEEAIELLTKKPELPINNRFSEYNLTALMKCCCNGDESINVVKQILKHPKLNLTIKDDAGENCLHYACYYVAPAITKLLLKREEIRKIVNEKNNYDHTPLDYTFGHINECKGKIGDVTIWNMMVAQGAQLSKYKQAYKQLDSKKFELPHSQYVDIVKSNSPKEIKENINNNNQENDYVPPRRGNRKRGWVVEYIFLRGGKKSNKVLR